MGVALFAPFALQTPLSRAAARGHEAVVRLLIKRDDVAADSRDWLLLSLFEPEFGWFERGAEPMGMKGLWIVYEI
jgi:hypothetical protein